MTMRCNLLRNTAASAVLRCSPAALFTTASSSFPHLALLTPRRCINIEHSSDVHKWRNPEKEEVKRQFREGVKLGSEFVKYREQETLEKRLIEEDKFTNWRLVYMYSLGVALLLIGLNLVMVFVKPNPSPEYVPYVDPSAAAGSEKSALSSNTQATTSPS